MAAAANKGHKAHDGVLGSSSGGGSRRYVRPVRIVHISPMHEWIKNTERASSRAMDVFLSGLRAKHGALRSWRIGAGHGAGHGPAACSPWAGESKDLERAEWEYRRIQCCGSSCSSSGVVEVMASKLEHLLSHLRTDCAALRERLVPCLLTQALRWRKETKEIASEWASLSENPSFAHLADSIKLEFARHENLLLKLAAAFQHRVDTLNTREEALTGTHTNAEESRKRKPVHPAVVFASDRPAEAHYSTKKARIATESKPEEKKRSSIDVNKEEKKSSIDVVDDLPPKAEEEKKEEKKEKKKGEKKGEKKEEKKGEEIEELRFGRTHPMWLWREHLRRRGMALQGHQSLSVEYLLTNRSLCCPQPPGSGKTLLGISFLYMALKGGMAARGLVVGPPSTVLGWHAEMTKCGLPESIRSRIHVTTFEQFRNDYGYHNREKMDRHYPYFGKSKPLTRSDRVPAHFNATNTALVVDEAHIARTLVKVHHKKSKLSGGTAAVLIEAALEAARVLLLTATPAYNYDHDTMNLLHMLRGTRPLRNGGKSPTLSAKHFKGAGIALDFWGKLSFHEGDRAHRPRVVEHEHWIHMDEKYYELYVDVQNEEYDKLERAGAISAYSDYPTYFMTALRIATNRIAARHPKVDLALDVLGFGPNGPWYPLRAAVGRLNTLLARTDITLAYLKEMGVPGIRRLLEAHASFEDVFGFDEAELAQRLPTEPACFCSQKAVIYSSFRSAGVDTLKAALHERSVSLVVIDGDTKAADRQEAIARFNAWPDHVVLKDWVPDSVTNSGEDKPTEKQKEDSVEDKKKRSGHWEFRTLRVEEVAEGREFLVACQYLLITNAGGEGINLKGTRLMVLFEPGWNVPRWEQVKGRGDRAFGHSHLPEPEQRMDVANLGLDKPAEPVPSDDRSKPCFAYSADRFLHAKRHAKFLKTEAFLNRLRPLSIDRDPTCWPRSVIPTPFV